LTEGWGKLSQNFVKSCFDLRSTQDLVQRTELSSS